MQLEDKIKELLGDETQNSVTENSNSIEKHVSILFEGQELSEEFKTKTKTIFEAAVNEMVEEKVAALEEEFNSQVNEAVNELTEQLVDDIDGFLNLVVEQWLEENTVAVENGLKAEIVGNFINGLKDLFTEHYINVPETEIDVLGEQAEVIEELTGEVNSLIEANISLQKTNEELAKEIIVEDVCYNLTKVEKEKVKALVEKVEFGSPEEFADKVKIIKESYTQKPTSSTSNPEEPARPLAESMELYTRAISTGAKF